MYCAKCNNELVDCTCDDIQERLYNISGLVYRKCTRCENHYSKCECVSPDWVASDGKGVFQKVTPNESDER